MRVLAVGAKRLLVLAGAARARLRRGDRRVLLYHRVEAAPVPGDAWSVRASDFRAQMQRLLRRGYVPVTLGAALGWGRHAGGREVLVAFDDGYRSVLDVAAPILSELGIPAAAFVVSGSLGGVSEWERPYGLEPKPLLTAAELAQLVARGFSVGSHSRTHADLAAATDGEVEAQIATSRAEIEALVGTPVLAFSVPFGRDDPRIATALVRAGYRMKITNENAAREEVGGLQVMPCAAVLQGDDLAEFDRKLTGVYDLLTSARRLRAGEGAGRA